MRILLLSTYFHPDVASTGVVMTLLTEELARMGHQITVITSMPHYASNRISEEYRGRLVRHERHGPSDVYRLYLYVPSDKGSSVGRLLNYATFSALSGLAGVLVGRHDVVLVPSPPLTNGLSAGLIGRLRRVPFVYNVQDIWPDVVVRAGVMTNARVVSAFRRLEQHVYRRAAAVTVLSQGFRQNLVSKGVASEKITVIPNFTNTDFIRPLPRLNSFSSAHGLDSHFVVLFAGNMGHSQGLETVIEAAQMLSDDGDIRFLIVGGGAAKSDIEAYASQIGLKDVVFLPFQHHDVLAEMYASADVCLVPLRKGFTKDSVPSKVNTIAAAARPMIASVDEDSETQHFVRDAGCGLWIQPEDPHALAEAIRVLRSDPHIRLRFGRSGREYVERNNSAPAIAKRYAALLEKVAGV